MPFSCYFVLKPYSSTHKLLKTVVHKITLQVVVSLLDLVCLIFDFQGYFISELSISFICSLNFLVFSQFQNQQL